MRDRWVLVYALFCLLQVPLYFVLGRGPVGYDFAMKAAEQKLMGSRSIPPDLQAIDADLERAQKTLEQLPQTDSRLARWQLDRALLAWAQGDMPSAEAWFLKSLGEFEARHGPDSFHACAVELRLAEFLFVTGRHQEALSRFERGFRPLEEMEGPGSPFVTRMAFRQASVLTQLGRYGQAAELAQRHWPRLLRDRQQFDPMFLSQSASTLEALQRTGIGQVVPPSGSSWRQLLLPEGMGQPKAAAE